jgi:hypothetical protein
MPEEDIALVSEIQIFSSWELMAFGNKIEEVFVNSLDEIDESEELPLIVTILCEFDVFDETLKTTKTNTENSIFFNYLYVRDILLKSTARIVLPVNNIRNLISYYNHYALKNNNKQLIFNELSRSVCEQ